MGATVSSPLSQDAEDVRQTDIRPEEDGADLNATGGLHPAWRSSFSNGSTSMDSDKLLMASQGRNSATLLIGICEHRCNQFKVVASMRIRWTCAADMRQTSCTHAGRYRPAVKRGDSLDRAVQWLSEGVAQQATAMEKALSKKADYATVRRQQRAKVAAEIERNKSRAAEKRANEVAASRPTSAAGVL